MWNGVDCAYVNSYCLAGGVWNGLDCVTVADECLSFENRAAPVIEELRKLRADVQEACGQDPAGQQCEDLTQDQQQAWGFYNALWSEAPIPCRTYMPDPGSLI
jgi:hypothetical protein